MTQKEARQVLEHLKWQRFPISPKHAKMLYDKAGYKRPDHLK